MCGAIGEVHVSTPCCIERYLDGRLPELWYTADGRQWFITGDLGYFSDEGVLFVTGRSNDVIVVAGVNVYPAIIEGCINRDGHIATSQVIGMPHASVGAVPVAVVQLQNEMGEGAREELFRKLKGVIMQEQGEVFNVDAFYTLEELGLREWPIGSTNKISKSELLKRVQILRGKSVLANF